MKNAEKKVLDILANCKETERYNWAEDNGDGKSLLRNENFRFRLIRNMGKSLLYMFF